MMNKKEWLKKLAWFVSENMSIEKPFFTAFAESFSGEEIAEFDKLTDELFAEKEEKEIGLNEEIAESLLYAISSELKDNSYISIKLFVTEFFHSLNRRGIVDNEEVDKLIRKVI